MIDTFTLQILITAAIFTVVGAWFNRNQSPSVTKIIETTIDRLISDGYIKTKIDNDGQIELVKHYED